MVVGLVLFARLGLHASYDSLLPGFMLFGAGAGLMNVPLTNAVMQAIPPARAGIASALLNASREVAGLLGITVIGAILRTRQSAALRAGADPVHAFVDGYHTGLLVTIAADGGRRRRQLPDPAPARRRAPARPPPEITAAGRDRGHRRVPGELVGRTSSPRRARTGQRTRRATPSSRPGPSASGMTGAAPGLARS